MPQEDLLHAAVQPLNDNLAALLAEYQWPPKLIGAAVGLVQVGEVAVLIGGVALLCTAMRRAMGDAGQGSRRWVATALAVMAAGIAAGVLSWSVRYPSQDISSLFGRWDHLVFSAFVGLALSGVPLRWRMGAISALSAYFVAYHGGPIPFATVIGGALLGYAALRLPAAQRLWPTVLLQGIVLGSIYAVCWRRHNVLEGLKTQGLFAFVLLRHISFVVEVRRGLPGGLVRYLCYVLFYPSCYGASEIYSEFSERNLSGHANYDYRAAVVKVIQGQLQLWASFQIDVSFEQVVQIRSTPFLWLNVLMLFGRSSLFVMGLWATIEGVALLYGFRLRPNFAGILSCENPAQFWHAWRATMTNWLIHYVYIPLGGNRQRQYRNIAAAFAVSTLWHCMGIPFFRETLNVRDFVPIGLWGALNALAVVAYVYFRRLPRPTLLAQMPPPIRQGGKIFLTACLGTFTVTLLSFKPDTLKLFPSFIRTLLGMD